MVSEAEVLIQGAKRRFTAVPEFANARARHAIRAKSKPAFEELVMPPWVDNLRAALKPSLTSMMGSRRQRRLLWIRSAAT
jgi:hypothetical protein